MTVSSATANASYTGNGSTQIFPIPFYFLVDTDIKVSKKAAATGVISTLTLNSDYTLTGAGNQAGGSATLVVAPASGDQIFIERNVIAVQETAYPVNSTFPAASHEKALDRLTMLVQQLQTADEFTLTRDPLADFYDVGGSRLTNMADGTDPADAVSLQQMTQAIAAAQITPETPAADVALYSVLAATTAGDGAERIGYGTGTVKDGLDAAAKTATLAGDTGAAQLGFKSALTGAIKVTLQNALDGGEVHSSWFGADKTGATDASAALQLALTAASGRTLVIDAGTYKLGTALLVNSNTTVLAYGASFNRGTSSLNNFIRNNNNGVSGGYTANANINIFGGIWDSTAGTGNCTVIALVHASRCRIRDAEIYNENQWHHIECNACDDVVIENCFFSGGYTTAFEGAEAIQIDCASDMVWPGPYDNTPCNNIVVRSCHFNSVSCCVGSHTEPASINHSRILVTDCFANSVFMAFVKGIAWSDVKVLNNKAQNIGYGFLLNEASTSHRSQNDIEVIGNTFYNVGNTTFTRINSGAIQMNGSATNTTSRPINVKVADNFIYNCTGTGLHAINLMFVQRGTVHNNIINNVDGVGIYLYGGLFVTATGNSATGCNNLASGSYASIKVGGTGTTTDTNAFIVNGNVCDTLIADYVNRTLITGNTMYTSGTLTANKGGGSTLVANLIGTTYA